MVATITASGILDKSFHTPPNQLQASLEKSILIHHENKHVNKANTVLDVSIEEDKNECKLLNLPPLMVQPPTQSST